MIDFEQLRHILFLDIETVSGVSEYRFLDDRLKTHWERKASYINENVDPEELFFERAGIYAEFGKVVCIGMGKFIKNKSGDTIFKVRILTKHDEKELLSDFLEILRKIANTNMLLCAHNGKDFDFPFLARRLLLNNLEVPDALRSEGKKPWEIPHLDTMDMWRFGNRKSYVSLELLADLFNIKLNGTETVGSHINTAYYIENDSSYIADYCKRNVVATAQLYLKLKSLPLIPEKDIVLS